MSEISRIRADQSVRRSVPPNDVRRQNLSALLRTVMTDGPIARADLAERTGLTTGTVTKLTAILGEAGLIDELASVPLETSLGRPRVPVVVNPGRYRVVGMHIGLLRTSLCLINLRGEILRELTLSHGQPDFRTLLGEAVGGVRSLLAGNDGVALGVGVSTGGWVDTSSGMIIEQPVLGWRDQPIRAVLEQALSLPVSVESSFRAIALAEHWLGTQAGITDLVHLFVGNVVGAGLLLNGRIYRGVGSAAGALDHLAVDGFSAEPCRCGRRNCLHVVASDIALMRRARDSGLVRRGADVDTLIALARSGDTRADQVLAERARQVGSAAGVLLEMLDPEVVIIGGGVVDAVEYIEAVREGARSYLADKREVDVSTRIRETSFGRHATSLSSAAVVLDAFYQDPPRFVPALGELRYG